MTKFKINIHSSYKVFIHNKIQLKEAHNSKLKEVKD